MPDEKTIWIPIAPRGQPRPRVTRRGGTYYPAWVAKYRFAVQVEARRQFRGPLVGPVRMEVIYRLQPYSTVDRAVWERTPDIDNLNKLLLDSLTGICYEDDRQIVDLTAHKRLGDEPGITIVIGGGQPCVDAG